MWVPGFSLEMWAGLAEMEPALRDRRSKEESRSHPCLADPVVTHSPARMKKKRQKRGQRGHGIWSDGTVHLSRKRKESTKGKGVESYLVNKIRLIDKVISYVMRSYGYNFTSLPFSELFFWCHGNSSCTSQEVLSDINNIFLPRALYSVCTAWVSWMSLPTDVNIQTLWCSHVLARLPGVPWTLKAEDALNKQTRCLPLCSSPYKKKRLCGSRLWSPPHLKRNLIA